MGLVVLGLDISTRIVGYTILEDKKLIVNDHIDLSKEEKNLYLKTETVIDHISSKFIEINRRPDAIFIEQPAYRYNKSTAETIYKLVSFNSKCSYGLYRTYCQEPEHIVASTARKKCGLTIRKNGINAKDQVFDFLSKQEVFKDKEWPRKRTGKLKDYVLDELDSYIIALAGYLSLRGNKGIC